MRKDHILERFVPDNLTLVNAHAKINLGLRILRKREDGYHDIETLFHLIDLFDTITFRKEAREIAIESSDPSLAVDQSNLCWRAARELQKEARITSGVRVIIEKRIPIGAGLGGGSSDAALVLRELPRFWGLKIQRKRLIEIAAALGSDVPYFLRPGTALATGRGEVLDYFDLSLPYSIVVVYPNIQVSTKWAYESYESKTDVEPGELKKIIVEKFEDVKRWKGYVKNDLEPIVFKKHNAVKKAKQVLEDGGADFVQMSGSGSAVYGLFANSQLAQETVALIRENLPVFITKPNFRADRS